MRLFLFILLFTPLMVVSQTLVDNPIKGSVKSIELKHFLVGNDGIDSYHKYYTVTWFNHDGKVSSIYHYGDDEIWDVKEVYEYGSNKKLTTLTTYSKGNVLDTKISYEYHENGKLKLEKKTDHKGKAQYQTNFIYNENALISKQQWFTEIDYTLKENYTYNEEGFINRADKVSKTGTSSELYLYNDQGQLTDKGEYDTSQQLYSTTIYTYNAQGDKTALYKYNEEGALTYFEQYEYKYDSQGNWIERNSYEKGIYTHVEKRTIKYF
jgi:hypothetical protein